MAVPWKLLVDLLEVVEGAARIDGMLVGEAVNDHVAESVQADQTIEEHVRIEPVERVVVEVSVGRRADVDGSDGEVVEIPVPGSRRMITPGIDHDAHAARRGDLEGGAAEERELNRTVTGRRRIRLQIDHAIVIRRHLPDVEPSVDISHAIPSVLVGVDKGG